MHNEYSIAFFSGINNNNFFLFCLKDTEKM